MRAPLAVMLALLLAGCVEGADDAPAGTPASPREEACAARGLGDTSCGTFCALHAAVCGLSEPPPAPYPTFPLPAPAIPPVSMPALNGTAPAGGTLLGVCPLLPTLRECPQL